MPHSKTSCLKSYSLAVKPIVVNYLRGHRIGDTGLPVQIGSRFKEIYFPGTLCFYTATMPRSWILPPGTGQSRRETRASHRFPRGISRRLFLEETALGQGLQLGALQLLQLIRSDIARFRQRLYCAPERTPVDSSRDSPFRKAPRDLHLKSPK